MTQLHSPLGPLPGDDELTAIASQIKVGVDARVHPAPKPRRTRRHFVTGVLAAVLFGGGAATGAAIASGSDPGSSERTGTSEIQLDVAPASAKHIRVSLRVSCVPGDRYDYEIDRSQNPASTICEKTNDHGAYTSTDYEFAIDGPPTRHTVNVTTNSKIPYTVVAQYASTSIYPPIEDMQMPGGRKDSELTPSWPTNEFGLTYGYATGADVKAGNIPDLRPFQPTPDGPGGFLRNDETYLPEPKTPEEEIARIKAMYNEKGEVVRNLYGPDGKTVLDTFVYSTFKMTNEDGQTLNPKTGEAIDSNSLDERRQ